MTTAIQTPNKAAGATPTLSALEWKVVTLAMREANEAGCGRMRRTGWFGRMLRGPSGVRPTLPLADPRLEALRGYVCRVRSRADDDELREQLIEYGFHPSQLAAVATLAR